MDSTTQQSEQLTISLSPMTKALLESLAQKSRRPVALDADQYKVSQTVSFFGFVYEKIRNAIEFNEEHLIRRHAISRILKRRLAINPSGKREGENMIRELLWGRYVPEHYFSSHDVRKVQTIIDAYILFFQEVKTTHAVRNAENLGSTIIDLMSCEIEETINKHETNSKLALLHYFYQTLKNKIHLEGLNDETRDLYFYIAAERGFAKNDTPFIMYHLFKLEYDELHTMSAAKRMTVAAGFHTYLEHTHKALKNPYADKLVRFAKKQVPPFKILYALLKQHGESSTKVLTDSSKLHSEVDELCKAKYTQTGERLRIAAIRSIIYIFVTKMIFVLIFEFPLSRFIYGSVEYMSIGINTLMPPLLMGIIVSVISPPSSKNTDRIYKRIIDIIDSDDSFETQATIIRKNEIMDRPILTLTFGVLYLLTFSLVFGGIYFVLDLLHFNLISKGIFIFFLSVVTFFAYRIRQTAKEYVLESRSNILFSAVIFLALPILYLGKIFSEQVSRVNVIIIFFDYLIDAPFKFLIEIVEEWSKFLRQRKDELV